MSSEPTLDVAAASLIGRDHLAAGRNNQDGHALERGPRHAVAVVADGCGSGEHSEVGAVVGARLVAQHALRRLERGEDPTGATFWKHLQQDVVGQLWLWAGALGADAARVLESHFLFTVVGALVTPRHAVLFALGDGVFGVNGSVEALGPFPDNAPPYLGYALLGGSVRLEPVRILERSAVTSLLIGTDGALALLAELPSLCADRALFGNRDRLRRRLFLHDGRRGKAPSTGPLLDDTTLVLLRLGRGEGA